MAVKLSIISTRKQEATNLTYKSNEIGGVTLTGDIYKASGWLVNVEDEETGLVEEVDLSKQLYGNTATIVFGKSVAPEVVEETARYFKSALDDGFKEIKCGVVIKVRKMSKPVDGIHPTTGEPTKTIIITGADLIDVEAPEEIMFAQEAIKETKAARDNRQDRQLSWLDKVKARASSLLLDPDAQEILDADKPPATPKKAANTRVKVAK
jgi:hypothetical protein